MFSHLQGAQAHHQALHAHVYHAGENWLTDQDLLRPVPSMQLCIMRMTSAKHDGLNDLALACVGSH